MNAALIIGLIIFFILGWVFGYIARGAVSRRAAPAVAAPARAPARPAAAAKTTAAAPAKRSPAKKPAAKKAKAGGNDNLKLISGVGPVIEKKLNKMGVTRYSDIAKWTKADVEKADAALNFKGRITRENWVAQAKTLAAGGETEFSKRKKK